MNVSIIGDKGLAKELGKKGTVSDLALYNTSFQGKYFTFIEPEKYPEKIQTLFQSINMSQFSILFITNNLSKNVLGECILALDMLKIKGVIVLDGLTESEIRPILDQTSLKEYPILKNNVAQIMEFLFSINIEKKTGKPKAIIDHAFLVKSVGVVALGTVVSGEIKKHDNLILYPIKKNVIIKSIQIHDKDYDRAECYERLGVSLKGVEVEDIERGCVISNAIECVKELKVIVTKNKFYKEDESKNVMCIVGLQYVNATLDDGKIKFSKEVVYDNEPVVILTPEKQMRLFGVA